MSPTARNSFRTTRRAFIGAAAGVVARVLPLSAAVSGPPPIDNAPLRLGLSDKVVRGVNLNDARAALAVWAVEIGRAAGVTLASQNLVLPSEQLISEIRAGKLDLVGLTVQEYRQVISFVDTSRILSDEFGGESLALVVREGGGITNLAGLRGRSLIYLDSPSSNLAEPWLAVSLWREGLESPAQLLGHITHNAKLAQVVLPVFFGQADACVVTHRGLAMMFELNPQLNTKLHVLTTSPKAPCAFFACRKGYDANSKKSLMDRLVEVRSSPAAKQVLTLFQSPGFAIHDAEYLIAANSILDAYERHHEPSANRR